MVRSETPSSAANAAAVAGRWRRRSAWIRIEKAGRAGHAGVCLGGTKRQYYRVGRGQSSGCHARACGKGRREHWRAKPNALKRRRGLRSTTTRKSARSAISCVLLAVVLWLGYEFVLNARANLAAQNITSGFGFLDNTAGFGVNQSLIPYSETDSYGRVFLVGLLNTLLVSALGIVFATVLGFIVGIARLSPNWLVARLAGGYVELIRNLPLLFQILFWYLAVLGTLPGPRQSLSLFGECLSQQSRHHRAGAGLRRRGRELRRASPLVAGGSLPRSRCAFWAQTPAGSRPGDRFPMFWAGLALIVGLPLVAFVATGFPISVRAAGTARLQLRRRLAAHAGIRGAVDRAHDLYRGLHRRGRARRHPGGAARADRGGAARSGCGADRCCAWSWCRRRCAVIVPPLTNQYLNLTKNSSLAVAIGYPDLVAVFAGTALNQTGQAIEIIAITMAVYLAISLVTSALMNWYNARIRLAER